MPINPTKDDGNKALTNEDQLPLAPKQKLKEAPKVYCSCSHNNAKEQSIEELQGKDGSNKESVPQSNPGSIKSKVPKHPKKAPLVESFEANKEPIVVADLSKRCIIDNKLPNKKCKAQPSKNPTSTKNNGKGKDTSKAPPPTGKKA
ncbi:hypothetical protein RSOL_166910, partial [Rhizoctonia solani AG-3 Rhs1AP]